MPIKKHLCKIEENNTLQIPKSLCDALGIGSGCVVRVYSNNNGQSFTVENLMSYENAKLLETYREENDRLRQRVKELEAK